LLLGREAASGIGAELIIPTLALGGMIVGIKKLKNKVENKRSKKTRDEEAAAQIRAANEYDAEQAAIIGA